MRGRSLSCSRSVLAGLVLAAGAVPAFAQGPFTQAEMIDVSQISLAGEGRVDFPIRITDSGDVFGYSVALVTNAVTTFGSYKTWRFSVSGGAMDIGLNGPEYLDPETGATFSYGQFFNAAGQVFGTQSRGRYDISAQDAWFFDGTSSRNVGLDNSIVSSDPFYAFNSAIALSENGGCLGVYQALVNSEIDFVDGRQAFVKQAWYARDGVTRQLGLVGPEYIDPRVNLRSALGLATAGEFVVGWSDKFRGTTSEDLRQIGTKGWIWNATTDTYTVVGLTGPDYVDEANGFYGVTIPKLVNASGVAAGISLGTIGGQGTGVWVYENGATVEIGLRGPTYVLPQAFETPIVQFLNRDGYVIGATEATSTLAPGLGAATWVSKNGTTRRIGPDGPEFREDALGEFVTTTNLSDDNIASGYAVRLFEPGQREFVSVAAWVQDVSNPNSQAVVLGLRDDLHTGDEGEQTSYIQQTNAGYALGVSVQYLPATPDFNPVFSNTSWVYDINANSFTVIPAPATASGRSDAIGLTVTPRGGVVGFFLFAENDAGNDYRPFYWSPRAGFVNLMPTGTGFAEQNYSSIPIAVSPDGTRVAMGATLLTGDTTLLRIRAVDDNPSLCDSIDFNNNTVFPEDQDVIDFFNVLAGGDCSPGNTCNDIDFNNNTVYPEDADVIDFFKTLAAGAC